MPQRPAPVHDIYLLLGSNIGDKEAYLRQARDLIQISIGDIFKMSSIYQTEPWHADDHDTYLNQVVAVRSTLPPGKTMRSCLEIERSLGRRRFKGINPRTIDIDILYYDDRIVQQKRVTIPHPRLHLRRFTLIPLKEIAPEHVHPVFGLTNRELLEQCQDESQVKRIGRA